MLKRDTGTMMNWKMGDEIAERGIGKWKLEISKGHSRVRRMSNHRIGIIGGSGLYHIEGFTQQKWIKVKTPFGPPSDDFLTGKLMGWEVVFLPRHGRGHRILPSELNHRANLWAMKKLGVAWVISVSAVGSLQARP